MGEEAPDERLPEDVAAHAGREQVLAIEAKFVLAAGLDVEQAHVPAIDAPRGLEAGEDGDLLSLEQTDAPAVERNEVGVAAAETGRLEDPGPLEEEGALLREEEGKTRQVHLAVVRLRLREVGVHGEGGGEVGGHVHEDVAAGLGLSRPIGRSSREVGPDVEAPALSRAGEPLEAPRLGEVRDPDVAPRRRPAVGLLPSRDVALDVEPPGRDLLPEAQGLEGDGELCRPALAVDAGGRIPDPVPVEVEALAVVRDLALGPRAARGDRKEEAVAAVAEGVEDDHDVVVPLEVAVAAHLRGRDAGRVAVERADAEVEVVVVAQDAHLGGLPRRRALPGLRLGQRADGRGRRPVRLVEATVEPDRRLRGRGERRGRGLGGPHPRSEGESDVQGDEERGRAHGDVATRGLARSPRPRARSPRGRRRGG